MDPVVLTVVKEYVDLSDDLRYRSISNIYLISSNMLDLNSGGYNFDSFLRVEFSRNNQMCR